MSNLQRMRTMHALIDWAEVGQIVWHGLITTVVLTYLAGWYLGRWLHRANDQLSRVWVALWCGRNQPGRGVDPLRCKRSVALTAESGRAPNPHPTRHLEPLRCKGSAGSTRHKPRAAAQPLLHPLAGLASELQELPATTLRQLVGTKRRCAKRELVALALAY